MPSPTMARSQLRTASPDRDARAIAGIYGPCVTDTVISFEEVAPSDDEMAARMRRILARYPYLVCETGGEVDGFAYASEHADRRAYRWAVHVSVYVAPGRRRQGVGKALYGRLFEILVRQGFHTAFAGITLPNDASVGLHEAMGFVHLGTYAEVGYKFGAWRDVGWWRRPLSMDQAPREPVPFSELKPVVTGLI